MHFCELNLQKMVLLFCITSLSRADNSTETPTTTVSSDDEEKESYPRGQVAVIGAMVGTVVVMVVVLTIIYCASDYEEVFEDDYTYEGSYCLDNDSSSKSHQSESSSCDNSQKNAESSSGEKSSDISASLQMKQPLQNNISEEIYIREIHAPLQQTQLQQTVSQQPESQLTQLQETVSQQPESQLTQLQQTVSQQPESQLTQLQETVSQQPESQLPSKQTMQQLLPCNPTENPLYTLQGTNIDNPLEGL